MNLTKYRPLLVLGPGSSSLAAASKGFDVRWGFRWEELSAALRGAPPSTLVVVEAYAGERPGDVFPRIRELLRRFPSVPVVAVLPFRPDTVADVAVLLEWGVSEVVALGADATPRAVRARLRHAHARPFKRRLETALSRYVSGEGRVLLMAAAEVAVEGGGARELARRLRVSPPTVTERCLRADLPPPRQVQAWLRILLACSLLDDPGRTAASVAYACGYSTDRSLRRAIRSFLDTDTTALRSAGAFEAASRAFNEVLRTLRETGRERQKRRRGAGPP
ncbi:MAG TPA: helix-turn-helix domain-containing protein [Longimicrobiaceae bacterium]|nr:helix-turn-helix domain-containing protein [Longimicrobiaceae bacterium]